MRLGALEGGGTKMVCAVGDENGTVFEQVSIPTGDPDETCQKITDYFKDKNIEALGIATFGPVDLNKESKTYGYIQATPKLRWKGFDILSTLKDALNVPAEIDTDVNGSCLGEVTYGAAKGLHNVVYITIGTGIGAGLFINDKLVHGALHPEMGHMLIQKKNGDENGCICPFHDNCFEGLASGPSIEKRWGRKAVELKDNSEVWELEADYIAKALCNLIMTVCPERIILGGGVMHQMQLFPLIRKRTLEYINGYVDIKELHDIDNYIVPASLNDNQGIMGALKLASMALYK